MVSQNWELRSATTQIVSDVSGLIIHKNERYWYNTDFEINCKQSELIKGRQIVRVIAHPMTISNFPSDFPDAAALAKLTEILTELGQKFEASELPSDYPDAAVLAALGFILTELGQKIETGDATLTAIQTAVEIIDNIVSGSEAQVDVVTQPSTLFLHDRKTYKSAVFDASASGNLVAGVANKVIKIHALTIQAQGSVTVNLNSGSGGSSLMEWKFQDREGAVVPFAPAPAFWGKTGTNTALYVTLSAAVVVTITLIYSDDDAS